MLFFENIRLALFAIRANKLRSFLTMLGIIIGISSVISITSIGASAQGVIAKEFESYEGGLMVLMVDWRKAQEGDGVVSDESFFTWEDLDALKKRFPDDIKYAELSAYGNTSTKVGRIEGSLALYGIGLDYNKFDRGMKLLHGRMINKSDYEAGRESIVIDVRAARHFFNKENVVGRTLPANIMGRGEAELTIVGVYERPPSLLTGLVLGNNFECYIPVSLMLGREDRAYSIELFANANKDLAEQGKAFANYLNRIKGTEDYYIYETLESQLSIINTVLGTLSVALGAIAGISLLVGGIGIMNIMLVSVTERTREIGIRKSLGARTKDILTQFLVEAMILSSIGGIIGTVTGITFVGLGMMAFGIQVVIQPLIIVFTVIFSAGVGMVFGMLPARKAAKLDPIEALRYE